MGWNFEKCDETDPGEHAFALVVYSGTKEIGVRCFERAEIRAAFGKHVFAWQPIEYPTFDINDMAKVVSAYQQIPKEAV